MSVDVEMLQKCPGFIMTSLAHSFTSSVGTYITFFKDARPLLKTDYPNKAFSTFSTFSRRMTYFDVVTN